MRTFANKISRELVFQSDEKKNKAKESRSYSYANNSQFILHKENAEKQMAKENG